MMKVMKKHGHQNDTCSFLRYVTCLSREERESVRSAIEYRSR